VRYDWRRLCILFSARSRSITNKVCRRWYADHWWSCGGMQTTGGPAVVARWSGGDQAVVRRWSPSVLLLSDAL
jgi:hypothetical protein